MTPGSNSKLTIDENIRSTMHAVYGHATGLASILVASRYTHLGVPSQLYDRAFDIAVDFIMSPQSTIPNTQAVEMRSGHCLLGALCVSIPETLLSSKKNMLKIWKPAFGEVLKLTLLKKKSVSQLIN